MGELFKSLGETLWYSRNALKRNDSVTYSKVHDYPLPTRDDDDDDDDGLE